jgi:hypothetical protein
MNHRSAARTLHVTYRNHSRLARIRLRRATRQASPT